MSRDVSPIFGRRVACKNRKEKKLVFGAPHPRATHFHVMKETRFKALAAQRGEHRRTKHRTKCRPLPFEHARKKKKNALPRSYRLTVTRLLGMVSMHFRKKARKHHFSLWHGPGHSACQSKLKAHIPVAQRSALNFFFSALQYYSRGCKQQRKAARAVERWNVTLERLSFMCSVTVVRKNKS